MRRVLYIEQTQFLKQGMHEERGRKIERERKRERDKEGLPPLTRQSTGDQTVLPPQPLSSAVPGNSKPTSQIKPQISHFLLLQSGNLSSIAPTFCYNIKVKQLNAMLHWREPSLLSPYRNAENS